MNTKENPIRKFIWSEYKASIKEAEETEIQRRNRSAYANFLKFVGFVLFVKIVF